MYSKEYDLLKRISGKEHLNDYTEDALCVFMQDIGEDSYRGKQLFSWIHSKLANDFSQITEFSQNLRGKLAKTAIISHLEVAAKSESKEDGTIKFLFRLSDGNLIETVYMPKDKRKTVCVSSQVGCALQCTFCATGLMGLTRNLTAGEIAAQILTVAKITGERISNVVFMGMGEPFHNYNNVIKAAYLINAPNGIGIGSRHITISTVGLSDKIAQYMQEGHKFKLAISISAGREDTRKDLVPISKKYTLEHLKKTIKANHTKGARDLTFEYVLISGVNDSADEIKGLINLANGLPVKINLIPYNSFSDDYASPSENNVMDIYRQIKDANILTTVRWSHGRDIQAGCGQLYAETKT